MILLPLRPVSFTHKNLERRNIFFDVRPQRRKMVHIDRMKFSTNAPVCTLESVIKLNSRKQYHLGRKSVLKYTIDNQFVLRLPMPPCFF